jgi:TetR/AcrR family transcriptional regulator, transcriptional repressor for nem operon
MTSASKGAAVNAPASVTGGRLTSKGLATRARIVAAASELMLAQGTARTTIEDIQIAAQVSASQMYHYFADKDALLLAVIDFQAEQVFALQRQGLDGLNSLAALARWRDLVVSAVKGVGCAGGCPLGSLASDLSEADPVARVRLAGAFAHWEAMLERGLTAMRDGGELSPAADPGELALALLASVQGGLLLSQVRRDTRPLEAALDTMLARIRDLTVPPAGAQASE